MLSIFSYMLPLIQLIQTPSMLSCLGYHRASQKYRSRWQRTTWNWTREKLSSSLLHQATTCKTSLQSYSKLATSLSLPQSRCHFWCSNDNGCSHQIFVHQSELQTAQYFENPTIFGPWYVPSNSSGLDFIAYGLWQWTVIGL